MDGGFLRGSPVRRVEVGGAEISDELSLGLSDLGGEGLKRLGENGFDEDNWVGGCSSWKRHRICAIFAGLAVRQLYVPLRVVADRDVRELVAVFAWQQEHVAFDRRFRFMFQCEFVRDFH